jgi:4-hydroxy-tetrahydrodipicolinate synthase
MMSKEAEHRRVGGIISAAITPFRFDYTLDEEGIVRNAEALIRDGVDFLVALGSIGEHCALNRDETRRVVQLMVEAADRRVPVIATVAGTDWRAVLTDVAAAAELGAELVMVPPPYYFPLSPPEVIDFYQLVDGIQVPFVTYSNPTTGGPAIKVSELEIISRLPRFRGAKDATPDPNEFRDKKLCLGSRWPLIAAAESQIAYALLAGADGILTATTTFAPSFLRGMWEAARKGDLMGVAAINEQLMRFRRLVDRENARGSPGYLPISKAAMELRGLAAGPPRPPVRALSAEARSELARVMIEHLGIAVAPTPTKANAQRA